MSRNRATLAAFVVVLVGLAFARATLVSSTGIVAVGDAADYHGIASAGSLDGRAPFVYRPLVPLTVGWLFAGDVDLGFGLLWAGAMFGALFGAGRLARDPTAGYLVATVLFLNYQVLFSAAYPARIDVAVLAAQVLFVWLALEDNQAAFFALLPLAALLKESLLLGLVALALLAFARSGAMWTRLVVSSAGFVGLHLLIRAVAEPTASMPPYDDGLPAPAAMIEMALGNLTTATALSFVVAWGGLCFVAAYLAFGGGREPRDPLLLGYVAFLVVFPLPLATDLHRAWFELLAPVVLFLVLTRARGPDAGTTIAPLVLAVVAGVVPYVARLVAVEHLYLLMLEERLSAAAIVALLVTLGVAGASLAYWVRGRRPTAGAAV